MRARSEIQALHQGTSRRQRPRSRTRHLGTMFTPPRWPLGVMLGLLLGCFGAVACERSRINDGLPENIDRCTSCHGTRGNPAPPFALNGEVLTSEIGVGAHQTHVVAGNVADGVPCYECHPIPTELITHPNWSGRPTTVELVYLAALSGPNAASAPPTWDRNSATCSNTYCHGATLSGASTRPAPVWTRVDGSQRGCTSCHGFPPAGNNHPASNACETCHGVVAGPGGTITNRGRHVDGIIDIGAAP